MHTLCSHCHVYRMEAMDKVAKFVTSSLYHSSVPNYTGGGSSWKLINAGNISEPRALTQHH
ncbi:hypothetical protein SERLA73DRAFT_139486 [Serpula lacrymans var. lacrymans S7.3]|uniref:Uncharacterized protein n=1 Tax=Serpula lacrymans var. lacrymans (strain S7.3) TaxID=936435 RepID=F8Q2A5_SERL3|nr:hypothetical protein SERLA73DRAFT_139486 [Serpula lacrymans var. lacrymans S7.3]